MEKTIWEALEVSKEDHQRVIEAAFGVIEVNKPTQGVTRIIDLVGKIPKRHALISWLFGQFQTSHKIHPLEKLKYILLVTKAHMQTETYSAMIELMEKELSEEDCLELMLGDLPSPKERCSHCEEQKLTTKDFSVVSPN